MMKRYEWDQNKNQKIQAKRGVTFEEVVTAIEERKVLDVIQHPNSKKYAHQRIYIVEIGQYAYLVPFVEDEQKVFLKTIIPSRKATRDYLINKESIKMK